jgi:hypothetical protein
MRTALKKLRNHLTPDGSRCTSDEDSSHDAHGIGSAPFDAARTLALK